MPFFFLLPLWAFCLLAGIALLFSSRLRFLGTYILLGSTFGMLLSFLLSLALLFFVAKFLAGTKLAWLAAVAYLAGIPVGGLIGSAGGAFLAYRLNRRLGWSGVSRS
jgi:hypothetical protein